MARNRTASVEVKATLPFDIELAVKDLRRVDPKLGKLIDKIGPCWLELQHMHSPFESLLESIVYQQLTGKAAATICGRVKGLYGDQFPAPLQVLDTADDALRGAGLSGAKVAAIKDLAKKADQGDIPEMEQLNQMADEEIVKTLTAVRGIGEWTVQMMLVFKMGRPDVLPINDYGVRKGYGLIFNKGELPTPKELLKYGERWRPWRTVASWYMWRALDPPAAK